MEKTKDAIVQASFLLDMAERHKDVLPWIVLIGVVAVLGGVVYALCQLTKT